MRYPGGKGAEGVVQRLVNEMPPHERYFEPFLGGGAVLRAKRLAWESFGCDLSRDAVLAVRAELAGGAGCIAEGLGGMREAGTRIGVHGVWRRRPWVWLGVCDGLAMLERREFCGGDLVYCDPPYPRWVRRGGRIYENEWDGAQHRRFLRCVRGLGCMVMVSSYWSEMYGEALGAWRAIRYRAQTRWGGPREEWCWMNFAVPAELHDYAFLGDTFRKREVIRRRRSRWVARLQGLAGLERRALLLALRDPDDGGPGDVDRASSGVGWRPGCFELACELGDLPFEGKDAGGEA